MQKKGDCVRIERLTGSHSIEAEDIDEGEEEEREEKEEKREQQKLGRRSE